MISQKSDRATILDLVLPKGSRKNKFPELALRFRVRLIGPIQQNPRNSRIISRISESHKFAYLRLRRCRRCPEDGMRKCVIFERALRYWQEKKSREKILQQWHTAVSVSIVMSVAFPYVLLGGREQIREGFFTIWEIFNACFRFIGDVVMCECWQLKK